MKLTKKRKQVNGKLTAGKAYPLSEAAALVKEVNTARFDASVDLHIRLGIDPKKADQAVRGVVSLPHGTGKTKRVLVLCSPDKIDEAQKAGAEHVGLQEYIEQIEKGWLDVDVIIATPSVMPKIARLGKILGPRNLMPNPKSGTVTDAVAEAVKEVKGGKIAFKTDKQGIIHASIGRVSFSPQKIYENAHEFVQTVLKMKPATVKGTYIKSITLCSTMSPGVSIDTKALAN